MDTLRGKHQRTTLPNLGQSWVRHRAYAVRDGFVRPVPGEAIEPYDPWEDFWGARRPDDRSRKPNRDDQPPYQTLLKLLVDVEREAGRDCETPGPRGARAISTWCAQHGLLGVLLQQVQAVWLAPRMAQPDPSMQEAFGFATRGPLPIQHSYVRQGGIWRAQTHYLDGKEPRVIGDFASPRRDSYVPSLTSFGKDLGPIRISKTLPVLWPRAACALTTGLANTTAALQPLEAAWFPFFPTLAPEDEVLPPTSEAFWNAYSEPVEVFLEAARLLRDALEGHRIARPRAFTRKRGEEWIASRVFRMNANECLHALLSSVTPALQVQRGRTPQPRWMAPSLLGMFAAMVVQDLSERRQVRQCVDCPALFLSGSQHAKYCSTTCRDRVIKRNLRKRQAEARDLHKKGRTPAAIARRLEGKLETVRKWLGLPATEVTRPRSGKRETSSESVKRPGSERSRKPKRRRV